MKSVRLHFFWLSAVGVPLLMPQLAVSQQERPIDVREILRQAARLVPDVPEPQQMSVASNIANTQARAGDLAGALSTVLSLKNPASQTFALDNVAFSVDQAGNLDGALKIIDAAATSQWKDGSYQPLAVAHAQKGDFAGALRLAHLIRSPGASVNALTAIAAQQYKAGDYGDAQQTWGDASAIADQARKADPSYTGLLVAIATSRGEAGETAKASALLAEVSGLAQSQPVDSALLSTVAMGFTQIGDITSALEIAKTLPADTNRDTCFMIIAEKLMKAGDAARAKENANKILDAQIKAIAFKELALAQADSHAPASAVATTKTTPTVKGRAEALAILAYEEAQKGDKAAQATVQLASAAANQDPANTPAYVFGQIAVSHAILGDFETAEQMTRRLPSDDRWWPLESIAEILVNSGDVSRALKLADADKDAYPRACALLGIANSLLAQAAAQRQKP